MAYDSPKIGNHQFQNPPKPMNVRWEAVQQLNELADGGYKMRVLGYRLRGELNWSDGWIRDNGDLTGLLNEINAPAYGVDSSVSLLLHGDGDESGSIFIDSSPNGFSAAVAPTATTQRDVLKFGSASMLFNSGEGVCFGDNAAFNYSTGTATIECWINSRNMTGVDNYTIFRHDTDANNYSWFYIATVAAGARRLTFLVVSAGVNSILVRSDTGIVPSGTWSHIALQENGNDFQLFVNGVDVTLTGSNSANRVQDYNGNFCIGNSSGNAVALQGYMDEFRFSDGVARYGTFGSSFTPPTRPYSSATQPTDELLFKPRPDTKPWLSYKVLWTNQEEFTFKDGLFGVYAGSVDLVSPTLTSTIGDLP